MADDFLNELHDSLTGRIITDVKFFDDPEDGLAGIQLVFQDGSKVELRANGSGQIDWIMSDPIKNIPEWEKEFDRSFTMQPFTFRGSDPDSTIVVDLLLRNTPDIVKETATKKEIKDFIRSILQARDSSDLKGAKRSVFCGLGFHVWTKWSTPKLTEECCQSRACLHCGLMQFKAVVIEVGGRQ